MWQHALHGCWNLWDGRALPSALCYWLADTSTYLSDAMWNLAG